MIGCDKLLPTSPRTCHEIMSSKTRGSGRHRITRLARSLSGRLVLALLTINLVLASLLVVFVLNTAAQNYKDRFVDQARSDAYWVKTLLETLPTLEQKQALLDDLILNPFRLSVQLFTTRGERLASAGSMPGSQDDHLHEDFRFGQHGDNIYWITLSHPESTDGPAYILSLAYDETPIVDDISMLYVHSLQLATLYLVLVTATVAGFSNYLARSLRKIRMAAHQIAMGNYEERFIPDNEASEIVDLASDLEHMRVELVSRGHRLAEQRRYLHTLLDHIGEGVVTFDEAGNVETCNPAALRLFTDSLRKPPDLTIHDWLPDLRIPASPAEPRFPEVQQSLGIREDGSFFTVELAISHMDLDGKQWYLLLIRDVSERVRIEEERRKNREELTHARRLSSLGEMAAGLAHELNQPLAAINLYIQGGLRRLGAYRDCPADIKAAMEHASMQAQRAGEIIRQIRGFVKKTPPRKVAIDINRLIEESLQLLEAELRLSRTTVSLELDGNLPELKVDRLQIQQVLINLLSNAMDAMDEVEENRKRITITTRLREDGEDISVSIADRGKGIPEDMENNVFTPFVSQRKSGLGLGLAISHTIIDEHGGQLGFSRRRSGGTVFTFTLPLNAIPDSDG